ncbi:MAG: hypothetical protein WC352_08765 [Candidatus Omnitrophota bacterium]|jgi:hypothetical protein
MTSRKRLEGFFLGALLFLAMVALCVTDAYARGGRGGGGGGYSRGGAASSGSFSGSGKSGRAPSGRQGSSPAGRSGNLPEKPANPPPKDLVARESRQLASDRPQNREVRSQNSDNREDLRQDALERQQDRQETLSDYDDYAHGGSGYPAAAARRLAVLSGAVIGATLDTAEFYSVSDDCSSMTVDGQTYYQCGSTWVQEVSQDGQVSYVVINSPF